MSGEQGAGHCGTGLFYGKYEPPSGSIFRPYDAEWAPLVRGQRVNMHGHGWRVTDISADLDGNETYSLELAAVVDARIEREREARATRFADPLG